MLGTFCLLFSSHPLILGLALRLALVSGMLMDVTQTFKYGFMIGLWFFTLVICHKKSFPQGLVVPSAWSQSEHRWNEPSPTHSLVRKQSHLTKPSLDQLYSS